SIQTYQWDFGDSQNGNGQTVTHSYGGAGTFNPKLTVTDNHGGQSSVQKGIEIIRTYAPHAHFRVSPQNGQVGTTFRFDGSDSLDDKHIVDFAWDFGDGRRDHGRVVQHQYNSSDRYTANLTVTDN